MGRREGPLEVGIRVGEGDTLEEGLIVGDDTPQIIVTRLQLQQQEHCPVVVKKSLVV